MWFQFLHHICNSFKKLLSVAAEWQIPTHATAGYLAGIIFSVTSLAQADGGNYEIKFSAARPTSYQRFYNNQLTCPNSPSGVSSNPLNPPANSASDDARWGVPKDSVQSLAPKDLGLGQVVAFEIKVCADGNVGAQNPENSALRFRAGWETVTTNNEPFGYDGLKGIVCAFIDPSDPASVLLDGNETLASSWILSGTEIQGQFELAGIDNGDCAIVEVWVQLKDQISSAPNGVVQSRLISAETAASSPDTIQVGQQTIPLKPLEFFNRSADVRVQKQDKPDPADLLGMLSYTIEVTNTSSNVVAHQTQLIDTLDSNTIYQNVTINDLQGSPTTCLHDGAPNGGLITCNLGELEPLETVTVVIQVAVAASAPVGPGGASPCSGTQSLCNTAVVSAINDETPLNNTITQPTGVTIPGPFAIIDINKTPDANVVYLNTSVLYRFVVKNSGTGAATNVVVVDDRCAPVVFSQVLVGNGDSLLDPGEEWEYTCAHVLTQDTINVGTVTATDVLSQLALTDSNSATVSVIAPALSLTKTANAQTVVPQTPVTYYFEVSNTGNDPLDSVSVLDDHCAPVVFDQVVNGNADAVLEPGETWRFSCVAVLTQTTQNTAVASGLDSLSNSVQSNQATFIVTVDVPTATSTATSTATAEPTVTPTSTPTEVPSSTPTQTPTATATNTPTVTVTATASATPTVEPTATVTPTATATNTATPTVEPTATLTATPTASATATATSTPTEVPTITATPTNTATVAPSATPTPVATSTATATPTPPTQPSATNTPTATSTPVATGTVAVQPTVSPTPTTEPPLCVGVDISNQLFALDGNALSQRKLVSQIGKSLVKKRPSSKVKQLVKAANKEAEKLYTENWNITWSIPTVVTNCSGNTSFCVTASFTGTIASYDGNAQRLSSLAESLINFGKSSKVLTKQQIKNLNLKNKTKLSENLSVSAQVPKNSISCS